MACNGPNQVWASPRSGAGVPSSSPEAITSGRSPTPAEWEPGQATVIDLQSPLQPIQIPAADAACRGWVQPKCNRFKDLPTFLKAHECWGNRSQSNYRPPGAHLWQQPSVRMKWDSTHTGVAWNMTSASHCARWQRPGNGWRVCRDPQGEFCLTAAFCLSCCRMGGAQ